MFERVASSTTSYMRLKSTAEVQLDETLNVEEESDELAQ